MNEREEAYFLLIICYTTYIFSVVLIAPSSWRCFCQMLHVSQLTDLVQLSLTLVRFLLALSILSNIREDKYLWSAKRICYVNAVNFHKQFNYISVPNYPQSTSSRRLKLWAKFMHHVGT